MTTSHAFPSGASCLSFCNPVLSFFIVITSSFPFGIPLARSCVDEWVMPGVFGWHRRQALGLGTSRAAASPGSVPGLVLGCTGAGRVRAPLQQLMPPRPITGPAGGLRPRAAPVPSRSRWSPENALPPQPLPPLLVASAGCGPPLLSSVPRASCQCL